MLRNFTRCVNLKQGQQLLCGPSLKFGNFHVLKLSNNYCSNPPEPPVTKMPKPNRGRIVWIDCEMTGLEVHKGDTILEVAVIVTEPNLSEVGKGINVVVHHDDEVLENMNEWCKNTFEKTGLTQKVRESQKNMKQCEDEILKFLRKHTEPNECPLAGSSVGQDAKFLAKHMPELNDYLSYRMIDVSSIKELCKRWNRRVFLNCPKKKLTHKAMDDIRESIEELKHYKEHLFRTTKYKRKNVGENEDESKTKVDDDKTGKKNDADDKNEIDNKNEEDNKKEGENKMEVDYKN